MSSTTCRTKTWAFPIIHLPSTKHSALTNIYMSKFHNPNPLSFWLCIVICETDYHKSFSLIRAIDAWNVDPVSATTSQNQEGVSVAIHLNGITTSTRRNFDMNRQTQYQKYQSQSIVASIRRDLSKWHHRHRLSTTAWIGRLLAFSEELKSRLERNESLF